MSLLDALKAPWLNLRRMTLTRRRVSVFFRQAGMGNWQFVAREIRRNPALARSPLRDDHGGTLLQSSSRGLPYDIARLVIRWDQSHIGARHLESQETALHRAAKAGREDLVQLLLENGANVNAEDRRGMTPLCHAICSTSRKAPAVVRLLMGNGGTTRCDLIDNALGDKVEAVREAILSYGDDARLNDVIERNNGFSPLHCAALMGHVEVVQFLVELTGSRRWRGIDLHEIRRERQRELEAEDNTRRTALEYAVLGGSEDVVKILLDNSVIGRRQMDNLLLGAARTGQARIADLLIGQGADVNCRDLQEHTPLLAAASEGHEEVVRILRRRGADVNAKSEGGWSALHGAVARGDADVAEMLIKQAGADVDAYDGRGIRPLHIAAKHGRVDLAELLLSAGASANPGNDRVAGEGPLHIACEKGDLDMAVLLIRYGADVNSKTRQGYSVLDKTRGSRVPRAKRKALEQILRKKGAK